MPTSSPRWPSPTSPARRSADVTRPLATLVLLLLAALAAPAATPQAQSSQAPPAGGASAQTPTFPAAIEQVIVDVVVTDKKGTPISGLTRNDLAITEDGVPQTITSFEAITLPSEPTAEPKEPPKVSVNTDPTEQRGRTFVIVFDDTHMTPYRANQAKAAVASFLEKGTRAGDRVSIVTTAGAAWWTARMPYGRANLIEMVKRLDGRYIPDTSPERMSDYEAMRISEYRDSQAVERVLRRWEQYGVQTMMNRSSQDSQSSMYNTVDDPLVTGRAQEVYFQAKTRLRATLEVLERALNGLATAKGRKSLILVSEGFIHDISLDEFRRVNNASRRANAAIYFVNSRGLEGMPTGMTAEFGQAIPEQDMSFAFAETLDAVAGAEVVSDDSGGFTVRNTNDLNQGIQKIASETQAYYLLGYNSTNTTRDGKFRKIQVKLTGDRKLQVRARKGYFAPGDVAQPQEAKKGVDPVIQSALDSPWAQADVPMRMTAFVGEEKGLGKAAVSVATDVDVNALVFEQQGDRTVAELQFLLVVAHRESGEYFRYDQAVNMKLLPATRERLSRTWYPIVREFELKPGEYQAKIVLRDKRSGRVGTVMHEFLVPTLDQFRVSTPVIADGRQPGPNNTLAGPVISARREFPTGSDVFCSIEVYGAKTDPKDGMPRVVQGYQVLKPDGSMLTGIPPSAIRPTSLGQLSRLFGFKLADAAPGDYQIVMTVRDELSGKLIELKEPFKVLPAVAAPAASAANTAPATPAAAPAAATAAPATKQP